MNYEIKTKKFNTFTGTRAEAIIEDLGENKRVLAGDLRILLPDLATLKDIELLRYGKKEIPIEIISNSLAPKEALDFKGTERDFYFGLLGGLYGIKLERPKGNNLVVLVLNPTIYFLQNQKLNQTAKGFGARLNNFLDSYQRKKIIFIYNGKTEPDPKEICYGQLGQKADIFVNSNSHNNFFNSFLEEIIDDLEAKELAIVGGVLEDQVLYTAIGALDTERKPITYLVPELILTETDDETIERGDRILAKYFKKMGVGLIKDPEYEGINMIGEIEISLE